MSSNYFIKKKVFCASKDLRHRLVTKSGKNKTSIDMTINNLQVKLAITFD